jgi:hypothetical protein
MKSRPKPAGLVAQESRNRLLIRIYFKAENLVLRARSESVGFAEIVNKDRMVGTKAQRHRVKTKRLSLIIS